MSSKVRQFCKEGLNFLNHGLLPLLLRSEMLVRDQRQEHVLLEFDEMTDMRLRDSK